MSQLLIPDAGPLFSLAAGGLLELLLHFRVVITDVVKMETIDRGLGADGSDEASSLARFYRIHQEHISVERTQVGHLIELARKQDVNAPLSNAGELSIQSLVLHLAAVKRPAQTVVLFEDGWFLRNQTSFHPSCVLLSTAGFLEAAESLGLIASAADARMAIAARRPHFYSGGASPGSKKGLRIRPRRPPS